MFGRKKTAERTCPRGHPLEESWEQCPFCAAEGSPGSPPGGNGGVEGDEAPPPDPGKGAVVVSKRAPAARPLVGWVVAMDGDRGGEDFRVLDGKNVIGKGSQADIVVKDAYLSERHALLEYRNGEGCLLGDLGSKHGTFVNGEQIRDLRRIEDGDLIRLGRTELRFRSF